MAETIEVRHSLRKQGENPEFGLLEAPKRNRAPAKDFEEPEIVRSETAFSFKSVGSHKSVNSKLSESSIARRKLEAEVKAMEEEEKLRSEVERRQLEIEKQQLERLKALREKKLELEMSKIAEAAEEDERDCPDDRSQISSKIDVTGATGNKFTRNERSEIQKWLSTSEEPATKCKQTEYLQLYEPTKAQMLARKTIGRDLPIFSGELEEWASFISQFQQSNSMCGFSDAENLYRLQRSLKGKARETVSALLVTPGNVSKIIEILERRFGRPEEIIHALMRRVKNYSDVKEERPSTIVEFGIFVQNLVVTVENLNRHEYLLNPQLLSEFVQKLPASMKMSWGVHCQTSKLSYATLRHFSDWLEHIGIAAQQIQCYESTSPESYKNEKKHESSRYRKETLLVVEDRKNSSKSCHYCTKSYHFLRNCKEFIKLTVDARWKWATENRRCFCCLTVGHAVSTCQYKQECGKDGCHQAHHPLLHFKKQQKEERNKEENLPKEEKLQKEEKQQKEEKNDAVCNAVHSLLFNTNEVLLGVLPVKLRGPTGEISTFALADTGSTATIMDESLADELGLTGPTEEMRLRGLNPNMMKYPESRRTTVEIRGSQCKEKFEMMARTVRNIELPRQSVHIEDLRKRFPYLSNVKMSSQENIVPRILIGSDNIDLIISREIIEGKKDEPILSRSKLGWILQGTTVENRNASRNSYHFVMSHEQRDEELHKLVKESFNAESFGVAVPKSKLKSNDDTRAENIMENSTRKIGDRWETALLWKCDDPQLPESKSMAFNRLQTIEKKMDRDNEYGKLYCSKIEEYLSKGYARKLTAEEIQTTSMKLFYLPHFGVVNPHKPGKLRIVFDAAAKSHGVSLNDMLLTGPDLYNSLVGILMRFRRGKIAFIGDICEMFPQIKIVKDDLPAQRFLFRGMNRNSDPDVYEMSVMLFGAACSPASAQYVKNRNAIEGKDEFSSVTDTILRNFYMDDYLDSVDEEQQAKKTILDVIEIHRRGGFDIRSWVCNSEDVLNTIPEDKRAGGKKSLNMESETQIERVLGLYWNSQTDSFTFKINFPKVDVNIVNGIRTPTKREVLKLIMSVFDPLGLIANFTVKVKILLQEVWKSGIDWDDELPEEINKKWQLWIKELPNVTKLQVPRHYSSLLRNADSVQLHVFVDSSMQAFCAVAYLRISRGEEVSTSFVMARTRVAPLKLMSMPRLELLAAVMGTRLANTIKEEIDLKINEVVYWSDSSNVLYWIRSEARKYKQFVAFRIGEILESTEVSNWRWIPTLENVADEGTRMDSPVCFDASSRWLNGPTFLLKSPEGWPKQNPNKKKEREIRNCELELRKEFVAVAAEENIDCLPNVSRFSRYVRLLYATAKLLQCVSKWKLKSEKNDVHLTSYLKQAEVLLLRRAQSECYPEEIKLLKNNKSISKSSNLFQLSPTLDNDGILRLSGRIRRAQGIENDVKCPIILNARNSLTKLIMEDYHVKAGHCGFEFVLNELRQKFYVPKARSAVRKIWRNCFVCRINKAKPQPPLMGELPSCRLQSNVRPFTHTGMDYCGPFTVTIGRRNEKRYVVVFTCMTTRAIHIEIANSLTTDSTIQAIRRMMSRRGYPARIYSDNGTNLKGADKEMKKALQELDQVTLTNELSLRKIEWFFIPPACPHMGGSWERLIRCVKNSLYAVMKEQHPKEETFATLLVEVENIVNSRPLTQVSADPDDMECITPNHFLIGCSSAMQPPGVFSEDDLCLRKQWRISQTYADMFWKRWIREYLPTLTKRTKWYGETEPVKISDFVIIIDDQLPRNSWPKGIVVATFPGKDGIVRVADVRTATGIFRRAVTKLCAIDLKKSDVEPASNIGGKNVTKDIS